MTAYVELVAHADGGYECGHKGCDTQAVVSEPADCRMPCKQAQAEIDVACGVDWASLIPAGVIEREQAQIQVDAIDKGLIPQLAHLRDGLAKQITDIDTNRATLIVSAKTGHRAALIAAADTHTHPHLRCAEHAADLGKHVAEATAALR